MQIAAARRTTPTRREIPAIEATPPRTDSKRIASAVPSAGSGWPHLDPHFLQAGDAQHPGRPIDGKKRRGAGESDDHQTLPEAMASHDAEGDHRRQCRGRSVDEGLGLALDRVEPEPEPCERRGEDRPGIRPYQGKQHDEQDEETRGVRGSDRPAPIQRMEFVQRAGTGVGLRCDPGEGQYRVASGPLHELPTSTLAEHVGEPPHLRVLPEISTHEIHRGEKVLPSDTWPRQLFLLLERRGGGPGRVMGRRPRR